jgi:predicted nucleic acid-binding protein
MRKQRIYIDTSVIGGCFDDEFKEWSIPLFDEFIVGNLVAVISDITIEELNDAPKHVRAKIDEIPVYYREYSALNTEAENLAEIYIRNKAVSQKYNEDAQHIALATVINADVLVSWNFKHIVNLERIRAYNAVNLRYGYKILEIRTPRELLYEKD